MIPKVVIKSKHVSHLRIHNKSHNNQHVLSKFVLQNTTSLEIIGKVIKSQKSLILSNNRSNNEMISSANNHRFINQFHGSIMQQKLQ